MRRLFVIVLFSSALCAQNPSASAQERPLARDARLDALLARVEHLERTVATQQETIRLLQEAVPPSPSSDLERQLAGEMAVASTEATAAGVTATGPAPITIVSGTAGRNYLNLSLSALAAAGGSSTPDVESLQPGGHDPAQRGFTVQNVETVLDGAVDPYFRGQANLILQVDPEGETVVELEEAYATTTSLPHNLQVKAGHFFTEFGRLNPMHPHTWDFVDQPLVNARMFGGDGMRSPGARVSWLMPVLFYSELLVAAQDSQGETLTSFRSNSGESLFGREIVARDVRALDDLVFTPRYAASFDPTDTQTVVFGVSAALGPNGTGDHGETRVEGIDLFWKWKAADAEKGFPFLKLQTEAMRRRYRAAATELDPEATFRDRGAYAQAVWGFKRGWTAGLRYDRVGGDTGGSIALPGGDPALQTRWRASTNVTWYPTEYSKLRLQYNRDHRTLQEDADGLWLQLEFLLGAHAAHKF